MGSTTASGKAYEFVDRALQTYGPVDCNYCKKYIGIQKRDSLDVGYCSTKCVENMMTKHGSVLVTVGLGMSSPSPSARLDYYYGDQVDFGTVRHLPPMPKRKLDIPVVAQPKNNCPPASGSASARASISMGFGSGIKSKMIPTQVAQAVPKN